MSFVFVSIVLLSFWPKLTAKEQKGGKLNAGELRRAAEVTIF